MNKYIIPYCDIDNSQVGNHIIAARSLADCEEKVMHLYEDYSDSDDWNTFLDDLDKQNILIGEIKDIEEL